jgi:hypothetical protein
MSVTQSFTWGEEISLLDPDPELPDLKFPLAEKWVGETKAVLNADRLTTARSLEKPLFEKMGIDKSNMYGDEIQSPALDAGEDNDSDNYDVDDGSNTVEENQSDYSNIRIGKIQGKNVKKVQKIVTSRVWKNQWLTYLRQVDSEKWQL